MAYQHKPFFRGELYTYATGYKGKLAAELALLDDVENDTVSEWEAWNAKITMYRNNDGAWRYKIELPTA